MGMALILVFLVVIFQIQVTDFVLYGLMRKVQRQRHQKLGQHNADNGGSREVRISMFNKS